MERRRKGGRSAIPLHSKSPRAPMATDCKCHCASAGGAVTHGWHSGDGAVTHGWHRALLARGPARALRCVKVGRVWEGAEGGDRALGGAGGGPMPGSGPSSILLARPCVALERVETGAGGALMGTSPSRFIKMGA